MAINIENHLLVLKGLLLKLEKITQFEMETYSKMALFYDVINRLNTVIENVSMYEEATINVLGNIQADVENTVDNRITELADDLGLLDSIDNTINEITALSNNLQEQFNELQNRIDNFEGVTYEDFNIALNDIAKNKSDLSIFINSTYKNDSDNINAELDEASARLDVLEINTGGIEDIIGRLEDIEQATELPDRVESLEEKVNIIESNVNANKGNTDLSIADLESKHLADYQIINDLITNLTEVVSGFDSRIANVEAQMTELEQQWDEFYRTDFNYNVSQLMLEIDEIKETIRTYHATEN